MIGRLLLEREHPDGSSRSAVRMLHVLCRREPAVASARRGAERCMVLLVFVGDVEIYSFWGG